MAKRNVSITKEGLCEHETLYQMLISQFFHNQPLLDK